MEVSIRRDFTVPSNFMQIDEPRFENISSTTVSCLLALSNFIRKRKNCYGCIFFSSPFRVGYLKSMKHLCLVFYLMLHKVHRYPNGQITKDARGK